MSWLRSAVNKAVEVGGQNSVSRAVRSYADTVVNTAVGGSKLFLDAAIEILNEAIDSGHGPKPTLVMYYDPDRGGEPMDFRDVFLQSQALESITLSFILEEPNQEELSLLQGIFRFTLMSGKEALDVTVSSVQDLAKAFSTYNEEVLAKRAELLQFVQDAMAGLKVNAEIVSIDSELSSINKRLQGMQNEPKREGGISSNMSKEHLNEVLAHVRLCSQLVELLSRKKLIMQTGDCLAAHKQKVDKLKVLSESLASSASQAETRILDNRLQREEALKFRLTKADEVLQMEKDLHNEIKALEKRKDDLEEELKQVTAALSSAHSRLHNVKEERDQFEGASNQVVEHYNVRDDELAICIATYRAEAKVCNTFINFLESTSAFKSACLVKKKKRVNDELVRHEEYFMNWATGILEAIKDEMEPCLSSFYELVDEMLDEITSSEGKNDAISSRKMLQKRFQTVETKMKLTFSVVERIKTQYSINQTKDSRISDGKLKQVLDALAKMKREFESIERPTLLPETPLRARIPGIPFLSRQLSKVEYSLRSENENEAQRGMLPFPFKPIVSIPLVRSLSTRVPKMRQVEHLESFGGHRSTSSDAEALLSKLKWELELEDHSNMEGVIEWESDENFDKEPRNSI
ncbi:paramyosin-like isoform X2 [Salvia splendens]|uniref:paramyosin-like isoform X2 n=1 Tax=Salvia splendens TaxID=180675 RepID=UPI001C260122|nr:paramyosin-like isoform X2 [Salvia splendens]